MSRDYFAHKAASFDQNPARVDNVAAIAEALAARFGADVLRLDQVGEQDYFERGIELAIELDQLRFKAVDISDLYAVEIDFAEDLERANELF